MLYGGAFGGVVTLRPDVFRRVNGYSLKYFGWGGEDDNMGSRYSNTIPHWTLCQMVAGSIPMFSSVGVLYTHLWQLCVITDQLVVEADLRISTDDH